MKTINEQTAEQVLIELKQKHALYQDIEYIKKTILKKVK